MYGKYTLFYESPKNWGYYVHAQTVCTREGGAWGRGYLHTSTCDPPMHYGTNIAAKWKPG